MSYVELETACGKIKGINAQSHYEFRGIPYGSAGRWCYPEQIKRWDSILDATKHGKCCFQHRAFEDDSKVNPFYHKEFRKGLEFKYGEDCQVLDIYTPVKAQSCPVLIYIHGGSFTGGSCDEGQISGKTFAEKGVILVAINYRLGAYGFCSHPSLTDEKGRCGNYGIYDQSTAIKWVYDNIGSFGGDNSKITLLGQSAGAMSVDIHLSNPNLKDIIKGAILLSGVGLQRCLFKPSDVEKTMAFWDSVVAKSELESIEQLRQAEPEVLYYAWEAAKKECKSDLPYTFPVYDGEIVTKNNFNKKTMVCVPCMVGFTCTDMFPFFLELITKSWIKNMQKVTGKPCYLYNFNRHLPGDDMGAWHCADLLYVFNTLDFSWRPFEKVDYEIAQKLSDAIVAFVKTGNPCCDTLPNWLSGYKKPMSFDLNCKCDKWHTKDNIKFMIGNKGKTM